MITKITCYTFTILLLVNLLGCATNNSDDNNFEEKFAQEKQMHLIKDKILNQLHIHEKDLKLQRKKKNSKFDTSRKKWTTNVLKQNLKNLETHIFDAFIPAKNGEENNPNLIFHFEFKHSIFKEGVLSKADLSFYKTAHKNEVEEEILAVAEVILGHVHVINTIKKKNTMEGWVRVDIKDHVKYWEHDFDDGHSEKRALKIMCINCKNIWTSKFNGEYVPYLTIALDSFK